MEFRDERYYSYIEVLRRELVCAMGCTEPISLAYAAAKAKEVLNDDVVKIEVFVSSNIIKNVKSVIVPSTNGSKGIPSAILAGIIVGNSRKQLEVLSELKKEDTHLIEEMKESIPMTIEAIDDGHIFDIGVKLYSKEHTSYVRIVDNHTTITSLLYDDKPQPIERISCVVEHLEDEDNMKEFMDSITIKEIKEFVDMLDYHDVYEILNRQYKCNMAIAEEGLKNSYGANIGKVLLNAYGDPTYIKARAYAAAASDARMNGCELPVVINSGSGNQGITSSVPVIIYARDMQVSEEMLYKALALSNLSTIHLKTGIGTLSAYCGAVSAGCGAGAGICYLHGGDYKAIAHTIVNALGITSGIVCDGAKASCAAKISSAVDAGLLGFNMYKNGNQFRSGDGLITKGVENTIKNIGLLARLGMYETDKEIIKIMLDKE